MLYWYVIAHQLDHGSCSAEQTGVGHLIACSLCGHITRRSRAIVLVCAYLHRKGLHGGTHRRTRRGENEVLVRGSAWWEGGGEGQKNGGGEIAGRDRAEGQSECWRAREKNIIQIAYSREFELRTSLADRGKVDKNQAMHLLSRQAIEICVQSFAY